MSDNNKTILESVSTSAVTNTSGTNTPNTGLIKDAATLKMLSSLSFWIKFQGVMSYIGAGFLILAGFIYALTIIGIVAAVIYWALAGFTIWMTISLWKSANNIKDSASAATQDEYNSTSLMAFNNLKKFYKITGILNIVSIVLLILALILLVVFGNLIFNNPEIKKAMQQANFEGNSGMMGNPYTGSRGMDSGYHNQMGVSPSAGGSTMDGMNMDNMDRDAMMKAMEQATSASTATQLK